MSESLFTDKILELNSADIINNLKDIPIVELIEGKTLVDTLVDDKVCSSKREAREMINSGAISLNNNKILDIDYLISKENAIDNKVILIKKGKKRYFLGIFNYKIFIENYKCFSIL